MIKLSLVEELAKLDVKNESKNNDTNTFASSFQKPLPSIATSNKTFSYKYIDNSALLEDVVRNLLKFKEIAFDCEGVDLSRTGPLTVASFCGCGNDNGKQGEGIVYLVDVKVIGHSIVFPISSTKSTLKTILESNKIIKVMFDSRSDSDALFHQFGVKLDNVLDLQVYDQGCRIARGEKPPTRLAGWIPYVKGMKEVMKRYLPYDILIHLTSYEIAPHSKNPNIWGKRPLDEKTLKYAANDIYIIKYMLQSMNDCKIPDDLMNAVIHHSNNRVDAFRGSKKEIVWIKGSKNHIIMEEHPIVPSTYKLPSQSQSQAKAIIIAKESPDS